MQIVVYVHRTGEGLPDHAKVLEVSQATAEAVRPNAHAAIDSFLNDIKTGWSPEPADAAAQKKAADAAVASAEKALADAKKAQADAADAVATATARGEAAPPAAGEPATPTTEAAAAAETAAVAVPPDLRGPLPDDFPGKAALEEAGITTYAKLRAAGDVTSVPGIGAATAKKIADRLAAGG